MKQVLNNKRLLIKIVVAILLFLTITLIIINEKRFSRLERVKIYEFNNDIINSIDEVYEYKDSGKYINFAIEYLYNLKNENEFTDKEVIETINNTFNKKYSIKTLEKIGISKRMAEKGIIRISNGYKYNYSLTKKDIESVKIYKYSLYKMKKINKRKFVIKYDRLVVENPYNILNYYNEININNKNNYDTTEITNYLNGNANLNLVKEFINEKNINKLGKKDGIVSITYIIKNNKLIIDEIK